MVTRPPMTIRLSRADEDCSMSSQVPGRAETNTWRHGTDQVPAAGHESAGGVPATPIIRTFSSIRPLVMIRRRLFVSFDFLLASSGVDNNIVAEKNRTAREAAIWAAEAIRLHTENPAARESRSLEAKVGNNAGDEFAPAIRPRLLKLPLTGCPGTSKDLARRGSRSDAGMQPIRFAFFGPFSDSIVGCLAIPLIRLTRVPCSVPSLPASCRCSDN